MTIYMSKYRIENTILLSSLSAKQLCAHSAEKCVCFGLALRYLRANVRVEHLYKLLELISYKSACSKVQGATSDGNNGLSRVFLSRVTEIYDAKAERTRFTG